MIKRVLLLSLLLFSALHVYGAENDLSEEQLAKEMRVEKKSWKILFVPTKNLGLDSEGITLAGNFPTLLARNMRDFNIRVVAEQEKEFWRQASKNKYLAKKYEQVKKLVEERDNLLFNEPDAVIAEQQKEKIEQQISSLREQIQVIEAFALDKIEAPSSLPIEISIIEKSEKRDLDVFEQLITQKADGLVWAEMTGQLGIYSLRIMYVKASEKRIETLWEGIHNKGSNSYINNIRDLFATLFLNRAWANLDINLTPENGRIYLDGQLIGIGRISKKGLFVDRSYEVEVYPVGYKSFRQEIEVAPYRTTTFNWQLEKQEERYITIETAGVTAEVYLGSRYAGLTPLRIRRPDYLQTLTILATGYSPVIRKLEPDEEENIFVELEVNPALAAAQELKARKEAFYWTGSAFTVSVFLPLIAGGIAANNQRLAAANRSAGFQTAANRYQREGELATALTIGGLVLSAGLLSWTIVNLVGYIQATEREAQPIIRSTYPDGEDLDEDERQEEEKQEEAP